MKKITYLLFSFLLFSSSYAQDWPQVGSKIVGATSSHRAGHAVSLSSDGSTVAIGTPHPNNRRGQVKIFENVNGTWTQKGNTLDGSYTVIPPSTTQYPDNFGYSVSLSNDGNTVAIGARYYTSTNLLLRQRGRVIVYKMVGSTWTQVGLPINGEGENDHSGYSVSLSGDGTTLAIGAPYNDAYGHVRIYKNINGTWTQIGADINGEAPSDGSGWSVSLSSDGTTVAIGAPGNDGGGTAAGHVRVYKNVSDTWTKIGADLNGTRDEDELGHSVSISADGSIVAVGATMARGTLVWDKGYVRVFKNVNGTWTQIGSDVIGEALYDQFGYSLSLSGDGTRFISGTMFNDGNGSRAGHARIFENVNGTWTQLGSDLDGDSTNYRFGYSVSLSDDGSTAAVGALYGMPPQNAGEVSIFSECITTEKIDLIMTCNSYTWINGVTYNQSNSTAEDTLVNQSGCDSVVRLNLTILESSSSEVNASDCENFVSPTGKVWTSTGTYLDTLANVTGCDSIITYNLTIVKNDDVIASNPTDKSVVPGTNATFSVVSTIDPNTTYQWQRDNGTGFQDLSNAGQYSGSTSNTLLISNIAVSNENEAYRCVVATSTCTVTSEEATLTIDRANVPEVALNNEYKIYPNPTTGKVNIEIIDAHVGDAYSVFSSTGIEVLTGSIKNKTTVLDLKDLSEGIYLITIGEELKQSIKVIKN
jgi:Flp pilus assembly pilin Flp